MLDGSLIEETKALIDELNAFFLGTNAIVKSPHKK